jgi:peptidoglycan-associated lipoprotein
MTRGWMVPWVGLVAGVFALALVGCQTSKTSGADAESSTGSEFDDGARGGEAGDGSSLAGLVTVYFDYDRYEIRSDAREALRGNADSIRANANWGVVTIEGHCDERGSEEYNLALGERRAHAVKSYLVDLGVPSSRLRTVSFGEAKPAVVGHDESAWRYNRRSEFKSGA